MACVLLLVCLLPPASLALLPSTHVPRTPARLLTPPVPTSAPRLPVRPSFRTPRRNADASPRCTIATGGLPAPAAATDVAPTHEAEALDAGPVEVTLELLEWPRLSAQVASFASTAGAREQIVREGLSLPRLREEAETLLVETREAHTLEYVLAKPLELRSFRELEPLVSLASKGGVLSGEQLLDLSSSLLAAQALVKRLRTSEADDDAPPHRSVRLLPSLFDGIPVQAELRRAVTDAIDDSGAVRDTAHPSLGELRFAMRQLASAARAELGRLVQLKADALASRAIQLRDGRYVLAVLAKQKHRVAGTVRDVSASGATLFVEPTAIEPTNTKLRQMGKQEAKLVELVLKQLSKAVAQPKVAAELRHLNAAVRRVDLAAARARYSANIRAVPVEFSDIREEGLQLPGLKHPLIVCRNVGEAPNASAMVSMDMVVPPGVKAIVITGPNTGGKTVSLKTLGMAALMARAGLWVLCADKGGEPARVPWFDRVMADIGDDQSIVQSLSTFSAHVARMRRIMDAAAAAPETSLVLLDEIGAGTDPTEGSAIGMAVLRQLASDAALTMSTTHHSRLKTLKYADPRFENACVEFDEVSMAPTYRLLWGIPGRSNAIAIAERLGLQAPVLQDARTLLIEEDVGVDEVVSQLQAQKEEQRKLNEELTALRDANERQKAELARQLAELASRERKMRLEQQQELAAELEAAKAQIAQLVKSAQQAAMGGADRQEQLKQTQQASQDLARLGRSKQSAGEMPAGIPTAPPDDIDLDSVGAGDRVVVPRLGDQPVKVEARKGSQLFVVFGGLKMKVKLSEVAAVESAAPRGSSNAPLQTAMGSKMPTKRGAKGSPAAAQSTRSRTAIRFESNTLDIRGRRPGEIVFDLGRAIDRSLDMGTLWVIHGRGTGALKEEVRRLLSEEPMVERFEDAPYNEEDRPSEEQINIWLGCLPDEQQNVYALESKKRCVRLSRISD